MAFKKYFYEGVYGTDNIKLIGTTSVDGFHENHSHDYVVDEDGNGKTNEVLDHCHEVDHFNVIVSDAHIHFLEKEVI